MYRQKTALALAFFLLMSSLSPAALAWHGPQPRYDYSRDHSYNHHRGYFVPHGGYYSSNHHGDDAVIWGVAGLILGSMLVAASMPPPPRHQVVYTTPPTQVYNYPPYVPPGMCRWERYILDGYGRMVLDRYGRPVKEYTLGSCQYPPN